MTNEELVAEYRWAVENLPGSGARGRQWLAEVEEELFDRLGGRDQWKNQSWKSKSRPNIGIVPFVKMAQRRIMKSILWRDPIPKRQLLIVTTILSNYRMRSTGSHWKQFSIKTIDCVTYK